MLHDLPGKSSQTYDRQCRRDLSRQRHSAAHTDLIAHLDSTSLPVVIAPSNLADNILARTLKPMMGQNLAIKHERAVTAAL